MAMRAWGISIVVAVALVGCRQSSDPDTTKRPAARPAAARVRVDFDAQIKPILQAHCLKCHARGKYKGGLSLESRKALLRGGEEGPVVVVGRSGESRLFALVAGLEPDRRMPPQGQPLAPEQVALLRDWIDQGLIWPEGFSFGFRQAALAPRRPDVPQAPENRELDHPIDSFVARYGTENGFAIDWAPASDRLFARRACLDLIGLLPTPDQLSAFEGDPRPDKHARLVSTLLANRRAYADHWLTFWNDALRNAYRGTGFIDGGRKTITPWLYRSLYENRPYDRFVHELISPVPGSEGFIKGIVWRGVVNASQAPPMQAAQNLAQVFLGTNLKCASCHDSFVNHWKLADAYALAGVFAEGPLEIHRCDRPTARTATIGFIYPELGRIDAGAPRPKRMKQLVDLLVKPENGRFARTIVNRLWAHLMGYGIVEPLDDMDQPPWSQDLLDWLASDFVASGYDLKHTLALISTSRAYRLPSVAVAEPEKRGPFRFRGPLARRMTAEQFADAVSALTGEWPQVSKDMLEVDDRGQGGQVAAVRAIVGEAAGEPVRAALAFDDSLLAALGRTSREQVVTRRDSVATTLQALEFINGATLDHRLQQGARRWVEWHGNDPEVLIHRLFLEALGRAPGPRELAAARELIGTPVTAEGVQDLLWAVIMLPEFQWID
ncbi:MAG: PSD1 domain-containing protein [Planctomycetaceae bacterium]|nr:PSD1 domain-containing protein [Planctomycetaceae bacterium]